MKSSNTKKIHTMADFELVFTPIKVTFLKKNTHLLKLYLEKGKNLYDIDVQVIGAIKQLIPPMAANVNFMLDGKTDPIRFRVFNQKSANYHLALYRITQSKQEIFVGTSQFKLSKFLEDYYREFQIFDEEMNV